MTSANLASDLNRVNLLPCYGVSFLITLSLSLSLHPHSPAAHQAKQPPLGAEVPQAVRPPPPQGHLASAAITPTGNSKTAALVLSLIENRLFLFLKEQIKDIIINPTLGGPTHYFGAGYSPNGGLWGHPTPLYLCLSSVTFVFYAGALSPCVVVHRETSSTRRLTCIPQVRALSHLKLMCGPRINIWPR